MNLIGNLLIAPPSIKESMWHKSVILVTEHHHQGSMGLILNKTSGLSVADFGSQLGYHIDQPGFVHMGGPVSLKNLSFLHTRDWTSMNTMLINEHICLSSAEEILPRMAAGDVPQKWRICLGLCGWGPGQLMQEINGTESRSHAYSWCLANSTIDLVFEHAGTNQWCRALDQSAIEFSQSILS